MSGENRARELIEIYGYGEEEGIIIFENPSYDTAFVGLIDGSSNMVAVYDYDKMIEYLVDNEQMTDEEAADFISYNSSFSQEGYPVILYRLE